MRPESGTGPSPRREQRRRCIPTAILRSPGETLEGIAILHELDGELGLVLWSLVRDVMLWAAVPAAERRGLFRQRGTPAPPAAAASAVPDALRPQVETLPAMLAQAAADAELLSLSCLEVAAWARQHGHPRTALAFAQAGALAAPEFSEAALQTAVCALEAGEQPRAETWLRRAIAVARRERNGVVYAGAYVLLGNLCLEQGRLGLAERYLLTAFRAARRWAVPLARRDAAYGLFRLALHPDRRDPGAATRFALATQAAYRKGQGPAAGLLLHLARFWIDAGQAARARSALWRLALHLGELTRADAVAAAALIAHGLAETAPGRSRSADARTWELLADGSTAEEATFAAALDLAHGAALRHDRGAFDRAARAVLRTAPPKRYEWARSTLDALTARAFPSTESPPGMKRPQRST